MRLTALKTRTAPLLLQGTVRGYINRRPKGLRLRLDLYKGLLCLGLLCGCLIVLFDQRGELFHQLGQHGQGTINAVGAIRQLDGTHTAILDDQKCHRLDVDTGTGAAAEQILVGSIFAVKVGAAGGKAKGKEE